MNLFPIITQNRKLPGYQLSSRLMMYPNEALVISGPNRFFPPLFQEIRHPLSNIILAGDLLKATVMDAEQRVYIDMILRNAERVGDMVVDLLEKQQDEETQVDEYSIHQLLDEVLVTMSNRIAMKNIALVRSYTTLDCKILVNKQKIKSALAYIMVNALNAMPSENGVLKLITKSINGKCVIEIHDNGMGMSKSSIKQIISAGNFDNPESILQGFVNALHIFKLNDAGVGIKSKEGKGTCFTFSFERIQ